MVINIMDGIYSKVRQDDKEVLGFECGALRHGSTINEEVLWSVTITVVGGGGVYVCVGECVCVCVSSMQYETVP